MDNEKSLLIPPFTMDIALQKVQLAEDNWNSQNPIQIANAYTEDTEWRNRTEFINGRAEVINFLEKKWQKELHYKLKKELWGFRKNRMAVRFEYEYQDLKGQWWRAYGNENWEFDAQGLMQKRYASINDLAIAESERKFYWPQGRRPDDHAGLSELGL